MIRSKFKLAKLLTYLLVFGVLLATIVSCDKPAIDSSESNSDSTESPKLEVLEYSFYTAHSPSIPNFVNDNDDVFAKHVMDKFKIKVGKIYDNQGLGYKERINLMIASNDLPDVISIYGDGVTIPSTGRYAELGDLIKENCPNYMNYVPEQYWKSLSYNGKVYTMGSTISIDSKLLEDNIHYKPPITWAALYTTEGVLRELGYEFTPIPEINARIQAGEKPSAEMYKITPEIKTEEDFYNFLKQIKLKIPEVNGKDVIPFSIPSFMQPHFAYIFGVPGHWKFDPTTKKVHSFFDDPNAKNYWKFMNKLYGEGLLDKEFSVQKLEQLQENILNGRIKSFMYTLTWPNNADIQKALIDADPTDNVRVIPMPMADNAVDVGQFYYGKAPVMFYINKDFKDIPRLLKYFDWGFTKEGLEFLSWGPESTGLWEMDNGVKKWKSEETFNALKNNETEYIDKNLNRIGFSLSVDLQSKIRYSMPSLEYNPYSFVHSYPLTVAPDDIVMQIHYMSNVREKAMEREGYLSPGIDDASQKIDGYIWGEFINQVAPELFAAKNEEEFNKAWDKLHKYLKENLDYEKAKSNMEIFFQTRGFK